METRRQRRRSTRSRLPSPATSIRWCSRSRRSARAGALLHCLHRAKSAFAEIMLVEPRAILICENPGYPLAVQVKPPIGLTVDAAWEICQAFLVDLTRRRRLRSQTLRAGSRVGQIERAASARVRYRPSGWRVCPACTTRSMKEPNGRSRYRNVVISPGIRRRPALQEMVKHQDLPAQAVGSDLEAGAEGGEGIGPRRPRSAAARWPPPRTRPSVSAAPRDTAPRRSRRSR